MLDLVDVVSQYPVLTTLAGYVSSSDLFHLSLASKTLRGYIHPSEKLFKVLTRISLCSGRGLLARQNFSGPHVLGPRNYVWGKNRKIWQDEEIEVRLWATKCETEALPCIGCGINICEECRYRPRTLPHSSYPHRRPHLNSPSQLENIMCLCPPCDEKMESSLHNVHLSELCDCDIFTRWICYPCHKKELRFTRDYEEKYTVFEYDDEPETKMMQDHQHMRGMFCMCGATIPEETRPRCTWCRRRHLPEDEWWQEYKDVGSKMPMLEDDDCYPPFIGDIYKDEPDVFFPKLKYDGPIYKGSGRPPNPELMVRIYPWDTAAAEREAEEDYMMQIP